MADTELTVRVGVDFSRADAATKAYFAKLRQEAGSAANIPAPAPVRASGISQANFQGLDVRQLAQLAAAQRVSIESQIAAARGVSLADAKLGANDAIVKGIIDDIKALRPDIDIDEFKNYFGNATGNVRRNALELERQNVALGRTSAIMAEELYAHQSIVNALNTQAAVEQAKAKAAQTKIGQNPAQVVEVADQSVADEKAEAKARRDLIANIRSTAAQYDELSKNVPLDLEQRTTAELRQTLNSLQGLSRVYAREQREAAARELQQERIRRIAEEEGVSEDEAGEISAARERAIMLTEERKTLREFMSALRANTENLRALTGDVGAARASIRALSQSATIRAIEGSPAILDDVVSAKAAQQAFNTSTRVAANQINLADREYVEARLEAARLVRVTNLRVAAEQIGRPDLIPDNVDELSGSDLLVLDANIKAEKQRQLEIIRRANAILAAEGRRVATFEQAEAVIQQQQVEAARLTLARMLATAGVAAGVQQASAAHALQMAQAQNEQVQAARAAARAQRLQIVPLDPRSTEAALQQRQAAIRAMLERQQAQLAAQQAAAAARGGGFGGFGGGGRGGRGGGSGFLGGLGDTFFGGGLRSVIRYSIPSIALFSTGRFLADSIREAEELDRAFKRLEAQMIATGDVGGERFSRLREEILLISRETGVAGDELANLALRIQGAFGQGAGRLGTGDNVLQGSDQLARDQLRAAAELARVTGISADEIGNSLQAISLAFGSTFREIGSVTLQLEAQLGVSSSEIVDFLGDIAPVLQEVGFEGTKGMTEFAIIASVAAQRSGQSASSIAERFGRLLPVLEQNRAKLLELASIDPVVSANTAFQQQVASGSTRDILFAVLDIWDDINNQSRNYIANLLGGRREAQALLAAFAGADRINQLRSSDAIDPDDDTLLRQFQRIDETLSQTFAKLGERIRQVGVTLLESGLKDILQDAADILGGILKLVELLVGAFGSLNDLLGGTLGQFLAISAALKGIVALSGTLTATQGVSGVSAAVSAYTGLPYAGQTGRNTFRGRQIAPTGFNAFAVGATLVATQVIGNATLDAYDRHLEDRLNEIAAADAEALERINTNRQNTFSEFGERLAAGLTGNFGRLVGDDVDDRATNAYNERMAEVIRERYEQDLQALLEDNAAIDSLRSLDQRILDEINKTLARYHNMLPDDFGDIATGEASVDSGFVEIEVPQLTADDLADPEKLRRLQEIAEEGNPAIASVLSMVTGNYENYAEFLPPLLQEFFRQQNVVRNSEERGQAALLSLEAVMSQYEVGGAFAKDVLDIVARNIQIQENALEAQRKAGVDTTETLKRLAELRKIQSDIFNNIISSAETRFNIRELVGLIDPGENARQRLDELEADVKRFGGEMEADQLLDVALQQLELRRQIYEDAIDNAETAEEALRIASEGFDIPEELRTQIIGAQLDENNERWGDFVDGITLLYTDLTQQQLRELGVILTLNEEARRIKRQELSRAISEVQGLIDLAGGYADPSVIRELQNRMATLQSALESLGPEGSENPFGVNDPGRRGGTSARGLRDLNKKAADERKRKADEAKRDREELLKAQADYAKALVEGDPVRVALAEQQAADRALSEATNEAERLRALADRVRADRSLEEALYQITEARRNLVQAQLEAVGDTVGAAEASVENAREDLARLERLFAEGSASEAQVVNARADLTRAETRLRDEQLNKQLEDYQFLYDTGQITRQQFVQYLRALQATLDPASKQFRDLERQIRGLQREMGQDLQFNLPSNFTLPTLYESRRINQSGGGGNYNDNRQITVTMHITNGMTEQQAIQLLAQAVGPSTRTGISTRRY